MISMPGVGGSHFMYPTGGDDHKKEMAGVLREFKPACQTFYDDYLKGVGKFIEALQHGKKVDAALQECIGRPVIDPFEEKLQNIDNVCNQLMDSQLSHGDKEMVQQLKKHITALQDNMHKLTGDDAISFIRLINKEKDTISDRIDKVLEFLH